MAPLPVAFLFNSNDPRLGAHYGNCIYRAFFEAVLAVDIERTCFFQLSAGDILFPSLARRLAQVDVGNGTNDRPSGMKLRPDVEAIGSLTWDFFDSTRGAWRTFDPEDMLLATQGVTLYAVVASSLEAQTRDALDEHLQNSAGYLGAMLLDCGNPVQFHLLWSLLINDWFYDGGVLVMRPDEDDDPSWDRIAEGGWWGTLPFSRVGRHQRNTPSREPPQCIRTALTARGERSALSLHDDIRPTHAEWVAKGLLRNSFFTENHGMPPHEFIVPEEIVVDQSSLESKLKSYCLNLENDKGGRDKATLFRDLLGIVREDWSYLATQLAEGLAECTNVERVRSTEYDHVQYEAKILVLGRNGARRRVMTAWKVPTDGRFHLVTAYVAKRETG